MPKFALTLSQFARGSVKVYNLLIDNIDQFEAFEDDLEDKYYSQFISFAATISQISENKKPPPRGKRRKLEGIDGAAEMRSNDLRLYYLTLKNHGYTICFCGYKKNQKKDIRKLNNLKRKLENQILEHGKLEIKKINKGKSS